VSRIFEEFQHPAFQHPAIQTKIMQHLGRFFHQIKVCQLIERKDSIKTVWRLEAFLSEAAQNFKIFSNIQDQNEKYKTYSG
jgi:hypothetical protein